MKHYIYKTTNLINGKIYIGKRSHENPEKDKYMGSGTLLRKAFNKLVGIRRKITTVYN